MWRLLILRDNWQGEFAVALFGALGWSLVSLLAAPDMREVSAFHTLRHVLPERGWEVWLAVFGSLQLVGLQTGRAVPRIAGAAGCLIAFASIFLAVLLAEPGTRSLSVYASSVAIEFCAIVYQTAWLFRFREPNSWLTILRS